MPLFFHAGALGDFLLSLPLLRWARSTSPGASWALAAPQEHARLVERIFPHRERLAPGSLSLAVLTARPRDPVRIATLLDEYGGLFGFIPWASELAAIAREVRPLLPVGIVEPFARALPAGETIESVLAPRVGKLLDESFAIARDELPPLDRASVLADLPGQQPFAIVHVGASDAVKRPPPALLRQQAARCAALGLNVVWARGPVECEQSVALPTGFVLDAPSLVDLAHAVSRATLFVGGDSGPTHLAAALGVETLAIHRMPNPLWRPRGKHVTILVGASPRASGS